MMIIIIIPLLQCIRSTAGYHHHYTHATSYTYMRDSYIRGEEINIIMNKHLSATRLSYITGAVIYKVFIPCCCLVRDATVYHTFRIISLVEKSIENFIGFLHRKLAYGVP
jgi:hypothetical protein